MRIFLIVAISNAVTHSCGAAFYLPSPSVVKKDRFLSTGLLALSESDVAVDPIVEAYSKRGSFGVEAPEEETAEAVNTVLQESRGKVTGLVDALQGKVSKAVEGIPNIPVEGEKAPKLSELLPSPNFNHYPEAVKAEKTRLLGDLLKPSGDMVLPDVGDEKASSLSDFFQESMSNRLVTPGSEPVYNGEKALGLADLFQSKLGNEPSRELSVGNSEVVTQISASIAQFNKGLSNLVESSSFVEGNPGFQRLANNLNLDQYGAWYVASFGLFLVLASRNDTNGYSASTKASSKVKEGKEATTKAADEVLNSKEVTDEAIESQEGTTKAEIESMESQSIEEVMESQEAATKTEIESMQSPEISTERDDVAKVSQSEAEKEKIIAGLKQDILSMKTEVNKARVLEVEKDLAIEAKIEAQKSLAEEREKNASDYQRPGKREV